MELVEFKQVFKSYDTKEVLKNINLVIPRGRIIGLLGKNGSGKTTLIKLMNDLLVPTKGEVLIKGKPVGIESKNQISYLPERTYLDKGMTVEQVLHFFEDFYTNFSIEKARKLMKDLNIDETQHLNKMSKKSTTNFSDESRSRFIHFG